MGQRVEGGGQTSTGASPQTSPGRGEGAVEGECGWEAWPTKSLIPPSPPIHPFGGWGG